MYAIIRAGGRQFKVSDGDLLEIDRVSDEIGTTINLTPVLLSDGDSVLSTPDGLSNATVEAEVVNHVRGKKIRVFNYHAKGGWKKTKGHRSNLTTVRIKGISNGN